MRTVFSPRPDTSAAYSAASLSVASSNPLLSAKMRVPACFASTSRCWLERIPVTASRVWLNTFSSSASFSRVSASPAGATRMVSLPRARACRLSRNMLTSLPSRNVTSGSIVTAAVSALAFFASRWVSMTSWLATTISLGGLPAWSLSAAICSVSSSSCGLRALICVTALPSATRFFSWSSSSVAFLAVFSHSFDSAWSVGCTRSELGGTEMPSTSPPWISRSSREAKVSRLSLSSLNAPATPCRDNCADLARRCESMRIWPVAAM